MINKQVKKQFKTWAAFANSLDENPTNFKRKILQNIDRLNGWLLPLGLEIKIALKKQQAKNKTT